MSPFSIGITPLIPKMARTRPNGDAAPQACAHRSRTEVTDPPPQTGTAQISRPGSVRCLEAQQCSTHPFLTNSDLNCGAARTRSKRELRTHTLPRDALSAYWHSFSVEGNASNRVGHWGGSIWATDRRGTAAFTGSARSWAGLAGAAHHVLERGQLLHPDGPRACSRPVAMPISAPMPNSPPSANWVDALCSTMALSRRARKRSAVAWSSATMQSVCCEPYLRMWAMAASTPSTVFTAMMASRYSVDQSCSVARLHARVGLLRRRIAAHLAAGLDQRRDQRRQIAGGRLGIDQQRLGGAAHARAPHLGVDDDASP